MAMDREYKLEYMKLNKYSGSLSLVIDPIFISDSGVKISAAPNTWSTSWNTYCMEPAKEPCNMAVIIYFTKFCIVFYYETRF